jgi:hypothetical protein
MPAAMAAMMVMPVTMAVSRSMLVMPATITCGATIVTVAAMLAILARSVIVPVHSELFYAFSLMRAALRRAY